MPEVDILVEAPGLGFIRSTMPRGAGKFHDRVQYSGTWVSDPPICYSGRMRSTCYPMNFNVFRRMKSQKYTNFVENEIYVIMYMLTKHIIIHAYKSLRR